MHIKRAPCEILARPVLDKDRECRLEDLLTELLPKLRRGAPSVPWAQLRKMEKNERRVVREKLRLDRKDENDQNEIRKSVTLGLNAVTRQLEKERVTSVLLDSGVEAVLMEHVASTARNKGIPILIVPFLKKVSLKGVGFASAAIGLKEPPGLSQCETTDRYRCFQEVQREIIKFARAVAPPENVAASPRKVVGASIEDVESCERKEDASETYFSLSSGVYEHRETRNERTFVPPDSVEKISESLGKFGDDFIALGVDDDAILTGPKYLVPRGKTKFGKKRVASNEEVIFESNQDPPLVEKTKREKDATYLPLKVKRIRANDNRIKATKIMKLKKKKVTSKGQTIQ